MHLHIYTLIYNTYAVDLIVYYASPATHRNTPQETVKHRNEPQHTATHRNTLHHASPGGVEPD